MIKKTIIFLMYGACLKGSDQPTYPVKIPDRTTIKHHLGFNPIQSSWRYNCTANAQELYNHVHDELIDHRVRSPTSQLNTTETFDHQTRRMCKACLADDKRSLENFDTYLLTLKK
jgi:hypothetical protein